MKIKNFLPKLAVLLITTVLLTSCGGTKSPDEVMANFKQAVSDIKSGDLNAKLAIKGDEDGDKIDVNTDLAIKFDRENELKTKLALNVNLDGEVIIQEKPMSGKLSLDTRFIDDIFYLNLKTLETNDESLKEMEPFINMYKGKWLKLAKGMLPVDLEKLETKTEEEVAVENKLKELFVSTKIFDIVKDYGTESVNGNKSYHYQVKLNREGIKKYTKEAGVITGNELTEQEIEESAEIVDYVKNAEIWIGIKDFNPYKALITFEQAKTDDDKMDMEIKLEMDATSFNKNVKIEVPEGAEEFNPLQLIMGGGMPAGMPEGMPAGM